MERGYDPLNMPASERHDQVTAWPRKFLFGAAPSQALDAARLENKIDAITV